MRLAVRAMALAGSLALSASALHAQFLVRSWLPWRTIETKRFTFYYPADLEDWTRAIASRVESIDSAVARVVGYAPTAKTRIVVDDPYELANGSAWPFVDRPVIYVWASPPSPRDDIGEFRVWDEMLVSHEFAHIAHLTRPSRNKLTQLLWRLLPANLGPIPVNSPRWLIEGYATHVEGRVTGSGRPHGAWRAAFLRQWALEGQLPRYDQLDATGGYEGGEFAYLAGSAFLEWLIARPGAGDSSLVALWRRMTANQKRTFDEAFIGVFGESPRALYGRFVVDVTDRSLGVVRAIENSAPFTSSDTGIIIQRLAMGTGDPAISPDGKRVALVLRSPTQPSRVVVWGTSPEPDTAKARRDSVMLARDPQDVAARPIYPPPKKALASLRAAGGAPYESPRFLRDGRILVSKNTAQGDGTLRSDLYVWDTKTRNVRRITHGASLHDADPAPDGRWAAATRCHGGWCDVVVVSLADGSVRAVLKGDATKSYARPRVSPDGRRFVVVAHSGDGWRLSVADTTGAAHVIPCPGASCYDPSWASPSSILAVADRGGIANLWRFDVTSGSSTQLTRVSGAAVAPEINPGDSTTWFLSLHSHGYDLRQVPRATSGRPQTVAFDPRLAPAIPSLSLPTAPFGTNEISEPRRFGLGSRSLRWLPVAQADADGSGAGVALASIDFIGRSEILATFGAGEPGAWRGATMTFAWRGTRPSLRVQAFGVEQRPSANDAHVEDVANVDARQGGIEIAVDGVHQFDTWAARYRVGGASSRVELLETPTTSSARDLAFADGFGVWTRRLGESTVSGSLGGTVTAGRSFGAGFFRGTGAAQVSSGSSDGAITVSAFYGLTSAGAAPFEQFSLGGGPSMLDHSLLTQRVVMPVLPTAISSNASAFASRASIVFQPVSLYVWAGSTAPAEKRFAVWHRVAGIEWTISVPAISIAGTPAARTTIGVGQSLTPPIKGRGQVYASLVLNP